VDQPSSDISGPQMAATTRNSINADE